MIITPTRSAWLHLRVPFSFFLLPVFVFALSQAASVNPLNAILVFVVWHLFIYPASNGYNSYFDKDEGSIALLEKPPRIDKSLYYLSLTLDVLGIALALMVGLGFALAVSIYGILSKLYSHPFTRLKKYPLVSFLVVFIFQGAFVYWASYQAVSGTWRWNSDFIMAGLTCSCLIGASYPLTQVYQHQEDAKRGDRTLSLLLGVSGTFLFSALLFAGGIALMFTYWQSQNKLINFWIFLIFVLPVFYSFITWFLKIKKDKSQANFKNMSGMTITSSLMMLLYFLSIWAMGI